MISSCCHVLLARLGSCPVIKQPKPRVPPSVRLPAAAALDASYTAMLYAAAHASRTRMHPHHGPSGLQPWPQCPPAPAPAPNATHCPRTRTPARCPHATPTSCAEAALLPARNTVPTAPSHPKARPTSLLLTASSTRAAPDGTHIPVHSCPQSMAQRHDDGRYMHARNTFSSSVHHHPPPKDQCAPSNDARVVASKQPAPTTI
jgi:hypothetical protein